jgi:hypothetical protein
MTKRKKTWLKPPAEKVQRGEALVWAKPVDKLFAEMKSRHGPPGQNHMVLGENTCALGNVL